MPNHCENVIEISGEKEAVEKLMNTIGHNDRSIDFDRIIPYPKEFKEKDLARDEMDKYSRGKVSEYIQNNNLETDEYGGLIKDEDRQLIRDVQQAAREKYAEKHGLELTKGGWYTDGFNSGGYEWCINNWGTKWNAYDFTDENVDDWEDYMNIQFSFFTAWSPPMPIYYEIAKMTKDTDIRISIHYYEGGMGFQGGLSIANGEVVDEFSAEYYGSRGG